MEQINTGTQAPLTKEINMERENTIQWQPVIELALILFTVLGSTIPLYLHTDGKIEAIRQDVKDFHGRLERQDAEFKAFLMYGQLPQKKEV